MHIVEPHFGTTFFLLKNSNNPRASCTLEPREQTQEKTKSKENYRFVHYLSPVLFRFVLMRLHVKCGRYGLCCPKANVQHPEEQGKRKR